MKKLLLLLIPLFTFSQEDIERYKVYDTTNSYTSLLLDSATGRLWHLQIGIGDGDQMKYPLSDLTLANTVDYFTQEHNDDMKYWEEEYNSKPDSIVSIEDKTYWKPSTLEERLEYKRIAKNGRFKLYPTNNTYNFIMVDVILGDTWQVQWNTEKDQRLVSRFY
tara:strand:- start:81 stop:569 length:489 start_codon:yes stop_codon:yes gene_type:complete